MSRTILDEGLEADSTNGNQAAAPMQPPQPSLLQHLSDALDADFFLLSGTIDRKQARKFVDIAERAEHRENAALFLCTYGGDADAAYIIARYLKTSYEKFILYVYGYCKSAGTLLALGADEIVMSRRGELGPLDVQLLKTDELLFHSSGLDLSQAIESLSEQAFKIFEQHFLEIIKRGGGAITTRTAADIASSLATGLLSPIMGQIDPLRVGEVERAINIALHYGIRLNDDLARINTLIREYPSHSFVIDFEEAEMLFGNVRRPTENEIKLEQVLLHQLQEEVGHSCLRIPNKEGIVAYLKPAKESQNETQQDTPSHDQRSVVRPDGTANVSTSKSVGGDNHPDGEDLSQQHASESQTTEKAESASNQDGKRQ